LNTRFATNISVILVAGHGTESRNTALGVRRFQVPNNLTTK